MREWNGRGGGREEEREDERGRERKGETEGEREGGKEGGKERRREGEGGGGTKSKKVRNILLASSTLTGEPLWFDGGERILKF